MTLEELDAIRRRTPQHPDCDAHVLLAHIDAQAAEIESLRSCLRECRDTAQVAFDYHVAPCVARADALLAGKSDPLMNELCKLRMEAANYNDGLRQFAGNAAYYAGLLDEIAKNFGRDAYISDDGSVQDCPLRAKMPEMVAKLRDRLEKAEAVVEWVSQFSAVVIRPNSVVAMFKLREWAEGWARSDGMWGGREDVSIDFVSLGEYLAAKEASNG